MTSQLIQNTHPQFFSSSIVEVTPAATPSDIFAFHLANQNFIARVKRIELWATANATGTIPVLLQRSLDGGNGTNSAAPVVGFDTNNPNHSASLYVYSSNRADEQGNGVTQDRPIVGAATLKIGTTSAPAEHLVFDFSDQGNGLVCRSLSDWIAVNLNKAALPAGFKISCSITWSEQYLPKILLISSASSEPSSPGYAVWTELLRAPGMKDLFDLRNHGTDEATLEEYLTGDGDLNYSLADTLSALPDISEPDRPHQVILSHGMEDVLSGEMSQADLTEKLEYFVNSISSSYPDVKIILWGPHALASDNFGDMDYVAEDGIFEDLNTAQAAQKATDILYKAYASFNEDKRVKAVVQKQNIFGSLCRPVTESAGVMIDQKNQSQRAQAMAVADLLPYLI